MKTALIIWMVVGSIPWLLGLRRAVARVQMERYRLSTRSPSCDASLSVSVIIPARDERDNIRAAVEACLQQDHAQMEVCVIDDGSSDGTRAVLDSIVDSRLRIIDGGDDALPEGWLGKPWACHRASQHARGDWLLFVDADVRLAPAAVSRSVQYAVENELGMVSGLGQLVNVSIGERLIQPVVTGMIIAANDLTDVNDQEQPEKALASGQFLLFERSAYDTLGGHGAVKSNVLDDVGLALAAKESSLGYHLVHMRELYRCRMYQSGAECWRGWRKNLFPGMERRWGILGLAIGFQWLFIVGPLMVFLLAVLQGWGWVILASTLPLAAMHILRWYLDGVYGQPRLFGLLTHIFSNVLVGFLMMDSAWHTTRGAAVWKGRVIRRADHSSGGSSSSGST